MGRRRAVVRVVLGLALLALLLSSVTAIHLVRAVFSPAVDAPRPEADALMVLGPADAKLAEAARLMGQGQARVLAVSDQDRRSPTPGTCRPQIVAELERLGWVPQEPEHLLCFRPDPVTTQGEAMALQQLGAERGWDSVDLLAYPEHISRARILVDRCWNGEISYLAAPDGPAAQGADAAWDALWYQSGALVKAGLTTGCEVRLPFWLEEFGRRL